ncbi:uncharacterized protein LOC128958793 [Oppia nitens]|uniref:uncharacterized protein LOC128958793 n=1 Tax=Oppia nitens TaxID=1686743 RepID=UPI0023DA8F9D|nr:uncharacterized protein LOC128958793 [Oppia nitens]
MANQVICLSTFEYTPLGPTIIAAAAIHCPACGLRLDDVLRQQCYVNRYTPALLLFGASVYIMYKLGDFKPKLRRLSEKVWQLLGYDVNDKMDKPVFFINTVDTSGSSDDQMIEFNESKLRSNGRILDISDIPDLDLNFSPTHTPKSAFWLPYDSHLNNSNNYNYFFGSDKCGPELPLKDNTNYIRKHRVPNGTVAKIDEVLTQIDDIKKSIVEIDSEIHDFSVTKCVNFNPDFFTLTNTDLTEEIDDNNSNSSLSSVCPLNDDYCDQSIMGTSSRSNISLSASDSLLPSTPIQDLSLEWDDTDSLYYSSEELEVETALSLPVTDADKQRFKSMHELLEEAKQMGLLNNILDAITYKVDDNRFDIRDSAYFEE